MRKVGLIYFYLIDFENAMFPEHVRSMGVIGGLCNNRDGFFCKVTR